MSLTTNIQFVIDQLGFVLGSGGRARVQAGGELDIESGGALKLSGTPVTANAAQLNTLDNIPTTWYTALAGTPGFTIGAEDANIINVAVQLTDPKGGNIASRRVVEAYLSADSNGEDDIDTLVAPDGGVVVGTNGTILHKLVTGAYFKIMTDASGRFDLDIGEAGAGTWYLTVVVAGVPYTSTAITFA